MTPAVLALDLSLTSTGWAYHEASYPPTLGPVECGTWPTKNLAGVERLIAIRGHVHDLLRDYDLLVIEDLPPATRGNSVNALAELHGVIRVALHDWGEPQATYINPSTVKRYSTGRGNANKAEVLSAAIQRFGYTGSSFDEADALIMCHAAMDLLGCPLVKMPASHRTALDKVTVP